MSDRFGAGRGMALSAKDKKKMKKEKRKWEAVESDVADFDEEAAGFTKDELAACVHVVQALGENIDLFRTRSFKALRTALHPLVEEQVQAYGGKNAVLRKMAKKMASSAADGSASAMDVDGDEASTTAISAAELDRKKINQTYLRTKRLDMLEAKNNEPDAEFEVAEARFLAGPQQRLAIADGAAAEDVDADTTGAEKTLMDEQDEASAAGPLVAETASTFIHRIADGVAELTPDEEKAAMEAEPVMLSAPRDCYICKASFRQLHFFYDKLCPECAELNYVKRNQMADMTGRVCLVTGARVKIGFRCALKLLRCGARVVATSRFPVDTAKRFAALPDFSEFKDRLHIYGLDFRDIASLEKFCVFMEETYERLDVIINNACQTIRRPPAYYSPLVKDECQEFSNLPADLQPMLAGQAKLSTLLGLTGAAAAAPPAALGMVAQPQPVVTPDEGSAEGVEEEIRTAKGSAAAVQPAAGSAVVAGAAMAASLAPSAVMSQMIVVEGDEKHDTSLFPKGKTDVNAQQVDLRRTNSWLLKLDEVSTGEAAEVLAINTLAPFVLNSKLKKMMMRIPDEHKFIVNVSAMEGKFYRYKSANHPHTNMAKAALNMMTRTSAADYLKVNIFMTAVDTGWINDEKPIEVATAHAKKHNFQTPLDEVDAAARVLDPVIAPLLARQNGEECTPPWGFFIKDYKKCEW